MKRICLSLASACILLLPVTAMGQAPATSSKSGGAQANKPGATATSPLDIVVTIYKISAGADGNYSKESAFLNKSVRQRYFSKSLRAGLIAMDAKSKKLNEPILDFDPITNSQDPDVKQLSIKPVSMAEDKAVIAASFFSHTEKEPTTVRYDFIKEDGGWKLDEVHGDIAGEKGSGGEPKQWSLRDMLK